MSGTAWDDDAWDAEPVAVLPPVPPTPSPAPGAFDPRLGGALIWLADIEAAQDGGSVPEAGPAWDDDAWDAEPPASIPAGGVETIRVSDMGWRGRETDTGGAQPYPPLLIGGPDIDRRVALAPGAQDTYGWGSLRLAAPGLIPGAALAGRDTALRSVRLRAGMQQWDETRGFMMDPPASALVDAFLGVALTWRADDAGAQIPLRDPGAWLDAPIGFRRFLGTGGAEGPAELAGTPWPIVRGGSLSAPVMACPVTLLDAPTRLYRWTDGAPGTAVIAIREDGETVYTDDGVVPDAEAATPAPGHAVHDTHGLIKLGSDPQGVVTVDGVGGGGLLLTEVLRNLLMTTLALPAGLLDEGSVLATAGVAPFQGGWAWTGYETGRAAALPLLAGLGARLVSSRGGGLRLWPLRALPADARPVARIDPNTASAVTPVQLGAPLTPPAAAWTVGWGRTHVTTTTPKETVSTAERDRLAKEWRTRAWSEPANLLRFAQASRPDLVGTALTVGVDAQALANAYGALWGVPRTLWQVTQDTASVLLRDIGDVVALQWPADGLRDGVLGQVVGDGLRAGDPTASLLVLV